MADGVTYTSQHRDNPWSQLGGGYSPELAQMKPLVLHLSRPSRTNLPGTEHSSPALVTVEVSEMALGTGQSAFPGELAEARAG